MGGGAMSEHPIVVVAPLNLGMIRPELAYAIAHWVLTGGDRLRVLIDPDANSKPTSDNRNRTCSRFLAHPDKPEVLFMVDADIAAPSPIPYALKMCEQDSPYDIIGMLCPAWQPITYPDAPLRWMAFDLSPEGRLVQDKAKLNAPGLLRWDLVGSGALLIHRRVLEDPSMAAPFADRFDGRGFRVSGHDFEFCRRAGMAGYKTWVAMDARCGHQVTVDLADVARLLAHAEQH